jgi:hypothetical protein
MVQNMCAAIQKEGEPETLQFEMLDGWDELGDEHQAKIIQALQAGHVEDDEWNGVSTTTCS